jgi:hypothetical protein
MASAGSGVNTANGASAESMAEDSVATQEAGSIFDIFD